MHFLTVRSEIGRLARIESLIPRRPPHRCQIVMTVMPAPELLTQLLRLQENQTDGSSRSVSDFAATDKDSGGTRKVADKFLVVFLSRLFGLGLGFPTTYRDIK
jgi:hypothetical protein